MRVVLIAALVLLQGCAFTQLRVDLSEFYSNPASLTDQVVVEETTQVTHLDSAGFSENYGRKGLWQPISFVREKRGGVYLLEPYDPAKVPVLFIHGAGGTPQDWRYFISNLDRTKYQPWVYYYPTGLPIDLSASWLNKFLTALHAQYDFRQLIVTGHSMGGLVARRFIALNTNGAGQNYVKLLVTLATPWGGVPFASLGAALGRYAVPSWKDLVPDSVFLRTLHAEALPSTVKHHLFFGYRESGDSFDSDGVIAVASQLGTDTHSSRIHGFKTDHSAILDDPSVFRRYASVLASFD